MLTKAILLVLLCNVGAFEILGLFPHPGRSHHYVFQPLLSKLAERGHRMTVVSHWPPKDPPPGWRQINIGDVTQQHNEQVDLTYFEPKGIAGHFEYLNEIFFLGDLGKRMCQKMIALPELQEIVRNRVHFDLVLIEDFNSDCGLGIAHILGVPFVSLQSHTLMPWSYERFNVPFNPSYMPHLFVGMSSKMDFLGRLENVFTHLFFKYAHSYIVSGPEREILERTFNRTIPPLDEIAKNCTCLLSNTHYLLNGVKPLTPSVREVGGMHIKRNMDPLSPELEKFINGSEHGVILFSTGSMIKASTFPYYKLKYFFEAFSKLKQNIIWKWDGEIYPEMPKNVYAMKWIPQLELLSHPKTKAFVSHGGLLGTLEALYTGVPVVFMPVFGDQKTNAATAELSGLGVSVPFKHLTKENVQSAMEKVLSPSMRESAARLSAAWRDGPDPLEEAVKSVEHVIVHGGHRRQSESRHLAIHEYFSLDIILFSIVILFVFIFVVHKLVKVIINILIPASGVKRKLS